MSAPLVTPDAARFSEALTARGLACRVEARERLAIVLPLIALPALGDAATRRDVHQLATTFGFTHVALELDADDATGVST